jgi:hypothetical protein
VALDATVGGPLSNAYLTVADASTLLSGHLGAGVWYEPLSDSEVLTFTAQREAALMSATRLIDGSVRWYGIPTYPDQALAWPQTGQVDRYQRCIPSTTIPRDIQEATALYAVALLENASGGTSSASSTEAAIKSKKVGDVTITYQDSGSTTPVRSAGGMPQEVRVLLHGYGMVPGMGSIPLLRT